MKSCEWTERSQRFMDRALRIEEDTEPIAAHLKACYECRALGRRDAVAADADAIIDRAVDELEALGAELKVFDEEGRHDVLTAAGRIRSVLGRLRKRRAA